MLLYIINVLITVYTFLLLVRVIGSWFPNLSTQIWMRFISFYTDPYLAMFRKIIPPLGILDFSALAAFLMLQLLRAVVNSLLG